MEQAERQNNAQLSRELRIALPSEFTREENIALVRDFVQKNFVSKGMCADVAYHIKDKSGEDHNPHVHISALSALASSSVSKYEAAYARNMFSRAASKTFGSPLKYVSIVGGYLKCYEAYAK